MVLYQISQAMKSVLLLQSRQLIGLCLTLRYLYQLMGYDNAVTVKI